MWPRILSNPFKISLWYWLICNMLCFVLKYSERERGREGGGGGG